MSAFTPGSWFIWQELALQLDGLKKDEITDELLCEDEYRIYSGNPTECGRGILRGYAAHICDISLDTLDENEDSAVETALANARLIAAAPDLYEALKELIDMDVAYQRGQKVSDAVDKARAALAKAERKS